MTDQNKNTTDDEGLNLIEDEVKPIDDVGNNQGIILSKSNDKGLDLALDLAEDEIKPIEVKLINDIEKNQGVFLPKSKINLAKKLLRNIQENNEQLLKLLSDYSPEEEEFSINIGQLSDEKFSNREEATDKGKVIEGVFDGENMIGPDGKQYSVPANYASKSKLVEGDILKLTITNRGNFIYKQIGPIERARIVGVLDKSDAGDYVAIANNKKWHLLTASVTYYKGESGDEIVILIPGTGESKWAAVENIVRKRVKTFSL
ncbi:MAG: hypothetical protein V1649_00910 [Patescibacteria group bacterium]